MCPAGPPRVPTPRTARSRHTSGSEEAGGGLRGLLEHRDFRRLLVGQGISGLGDWMGTVALMALVHKITGSALAVGGIIVLRLAPTVVAGPVAPRVVHRWDRRRTMLAMDVFRAVTVAMIPFLDALWWIYLWAFLLEFGSMVFLPARDSAVPDVIADEHDLSLANGLVLGSSYGMIPVGAAAFGAVEALGGGIAMALWIDAGTFLVSFAFIFGIKAIDTAHEGAGRAAEAEDDGEDVGAGVGFLDALRLPLVRPIAPVAAVVAVGLGALFSLGIVFVESVLGAEDDDFGVLVAMFGVGAAAGLAATRLLGRPGFAGIAAATAGQGAVVAGTSLVPAIGYAFGGAVLFGGLTAVVLAASMSLLQEHVSGTERVMAFTVFHVVIKAGLAVSAIATGAAADVLGDVSVPGLGTLAPARVVLFCSGLLVLAAAVVSRWRAPAELLRG